LEAVCEPALRFTFPRQDALREHLNRSTDYAALLATSPRAGRAVHQAFRADEACRVAWQGRRAYVVGPKTGRWMRKLGFEVRGEETGSATALGRLIVEDSNDEPLLFLCGNRRRDALPNALRDAGRAFEELVVYETHPRTTLDLPASEPRPWLVFFSPSGLEAVEGAGEAPVNYRLGAIGPTTAGALREAGHKVDAVAEVPSPEGLVEAIQETERDNPSTE